MPHRKLTNNDCRWVRIELNGCIGMLKLFIGSMKMLPTESVFQDDRKEGAIQHMESAIHDLLEWWHLVQYIPPEKRENQPTFPLTKPRPETTIQEDGTNPTGQTDDAT